MPPKSGASFASSAHAAAGMDPSRSTRTPIFMQRCWKRARAFRMTLRRDEAPGQMASGSIAVNGQKLEAGDGMAVEGAGDLHLEAETSAEVLLFDMAA